MTLGQMNGGTTQELSPEWMPASSMCSMMPPMMTAPVLSATASTSNSKASSRNLSTSTGAPATRQRRASCSDRASPCRTRWPSRVRRGHTMAARPPEIRSRRRQRGLLRAMSRLPLFGCVMLSSRRNSAKRSRSSARSIESGDVPRILTSARCSASASFSGVWPPNCTRHETSPPPERSTLMIAMTSSNVSGWKYNRSAVS